MKVLIITALVFAVGYAELDRAFKEKMMKEIADEVTACAKQEHPTEDDFEDLISGKALTKKGAKCLLACVYERTNILDKNGKLNLDAAVLSLEPFKSADADIYGKLKQVTTKCISSAASAGDRCETAGKFVDCSKAGYIEVGLSPDFLKV